MDRDATSLNAWLGGLCQDHFDTVLALSGEQPGPRSPYELGLLARRLTTRSAVAAAVRVLPVPALQLAGVLVAIGDGTADTARAAKLLGAEAGPDREHLTHWLSVLMDYALVWPAGPPYGPEVVRVNPGLPPQSCALGAIGATVHQRLLWVPTESLRAIGERWGVQASDRAALVEALGRRLADLGAIRRMVAGAPAAAMTFLLHAADEAAGVRRRENEEPAPLSWIDDEACEQIEGRLWAERHGLAFPAGWDVDGRARYHLAAETVLALMSDDVVLAFDPEPPPVSLVHLPDDENADEARRVVAAVQDDFRRLFTALEARPAALLRRRLGGVGVRELRRIARQAALDEPTVRLFMGVADELGLLRWTYDGVVPAEDAVDRLRCPSEDWMGTSIRAWCRLTRPFRVDGDGAALAQCDADARQIREELFEQIHALPPAHGFAGPHEIAAFARWRLPLAFDPFTERRTEAAWWEAKRLGILVGGALAPLAGCAVQPAR